MDDLKKALSAYSAPETPDGLADRVLRRIERGDKKAANPLLAPGLACISFGLVLSIVLKADVAAAAIRLFEIIGGYLK